MLTVNNSKEQSKEKQLDSTRFAMLDNEMQGLRKMLLQAMLQDSLEAQQQAQAKIAQELADREQEKASRDSIIADKIAALDAVLLADGTIDCRYNQLGAGAYTNDVFQNPYMQPGGTTDPSYFLLGEPGDCVPLNPFGDGTQMSDAAIDYVGGMVSTRTTTEQNYNFGYISGPVADLPAGELSVLVGYEERTESYK